MIPVTVNVQATVSIQCGECQRRIVQTLFLSEDSLSTGNTTEKAAYQVGQSRQSITEEAQRRGWRTDPSGTFRCGRCWDPSD